MANFLTHIFRPPRVEEERSWERENVRQKTSRYLETNPLDRFASDPAYRDKVEITESHLRGIDGLVLDLGGNTAGEATILQQHGFQLVVSDINEYALDVSRQRIRKFGLKEPHFVALDAHHLPFKDGVFAAVTVLEALHHFADYDRALAEIHRVLAPGGRLFSLEPNALNPLRRASEVRDRLRGTIEKSFHRSQLVALCRKAGFERIEIAPFLSERSEWKLAELPPYRRWIARSHGRLCSRFPTVFAAHAIDARKAGTPAPVPIPATLGEILQSPLSSAPLEYSAASSRWLDRKSGRSFPDADGIPVLIAEDAKPIAE